MVAKRAVCLVAASLTLAGCGIGGSDSKTTGGSQTFDRGAVEATNKAQGLVEHYCAPAKTEAAYVKCLGSTTADQVCALDTPAKRKALAGYIDETGDKRACK